MQFHKYLILINALQHTLAAATTTTTTTTTSSTTTMTMSGTAAPNVHQNDSVAITNTHTNTNTNTSAAVNEHENEMDFEQLLSQQLQRETNSATNSATADKLLLSRKRRYLLFPEGSSFQLVYDEIIGVVDYTNYLILGITVAIAWELPSKPPSEMIEEITEHLQDGSLIGITIRNDTATNITYVDTKPTQQPVNYINFANTQTKGSTAGGSRPGYNYYYTNSRVPSFQVPMHKKYYYGANSYYSRPRPESTNKYTYYANSKDNSKDWRRKDNYYYSEKPKNPFANWFKRRPNFGFTPNVSGQNHDVKYPWWKLNQSRLSNSVPGKPQPTGATRRVDNGNASSQRQKQQQRPQQHQPPAGYYQSNSAAARKHRIYPVFGKRSIPDGNSSRNSSSPLPGTSHHRQRRSGIAGPQLSKLDRIHIRHHRRTRRTLYDKIEKYLDKRGSDGHHCVLRALCETGQKSEDRLPGSFVGELMRAVFTVPEALEQDVLDRRVEYKEHRYDAANAFAGDCAARYQLCKDSLWQSHIVA